MCHFIVQIDLKYCIYVENKKGEIIHKPSFYFHQISLSIKGGGVEAQTNSLFETISLTTFLYTLIRASATYSSNFCTVWRINSGFYLYLPTFSNTFSNRFSIPFSISFKYYFFIHYLFFF